MALAGSARTLAGCPFDATLELSSINGANGFVINGIDVFDRCGASVSSAGDINGDGIDDLIIGAPYADPNGSFSGESYVVFGGSDIGVAGVIELSSLDGSNGFVINGIIANDRSGNSVSKAGDVNGDGVDDLVIGAYLASPHGLQSGESYVVFGGAGIGGGGVFELSSLGGSNGFVINGIELADRSGSSVSYAGDVNGDGFDDLIIGAVYADPNGSKSGESYVVFGGAGIGASGSLELASLVGANGFTLNGAGIKDYSGRSVSYAGDVNGDGVDDLIIGAPQNNYYSNSYTGKCYIVFGSLDIGANVTLELSSLDGVNGFGISGVGVDDQCGFSVSSAGDVNGDGIDDIVIGAPHGAYPYYNTGVGKSYVVYGGASIGASGLLNLASLDGANGFVCVGNDGDEAGHAVSCAGDVNGDGVDDLIIGAFKADPDNVYDGGESYVIFGGVGVGDGGNINLVAMDGVNGFIFRGGMQGTNGPARQSGVSVSTAGDVNGDGVDDVIVGADRSSPHVNNEGTAYVIFGQQALLPADFNNDGVTDTADLGALIGRFGEGGPAGDLNGDGVVDTADLGILIGELGTTCP